MPARKTKKKPRNRWKLISKEWGYLKTEENQFGVQRSRFHKAEYFKMPEKK